MNVYAAYRENAPGRVRRGTRRERVRAWDFMIAESAIDFRRELRLDDDAVLVRCRLGRIGFRA